MSKSNLYVKLLASDNTYLKYPCYGLLEIIEFGTTGSIIVAVFRVAVEGKLSAPVRVQRPKFEYSPRIASNGHAAVVDLVQRQHDGRMRDAQQVGSGEAQEFIFTQAADAITTTFNPVAGFVEHPEEVLDLLSQMTCIILTPAGRVAARDLGLKVAAIGAPTVAALVDVWWSVPDSEDFAAELHDFARALRRVAIPGA